MQDLNSIRSRVALNVVDIDEQAVVSDAILHERRVELFSEWGHRWLDIKRVGKVDELMTHYSTLKGGTWSTNWQWYPIPINDLQKDVNLYQNTGY